VPGQNELILSSGSLGPGSFAYHCLMSRRMAERGVRFTQIYQRGCDIHGKLIKDILA
jgi:Protein of unknown function (DUF1501)